MMDSDDTDTASEGEGEKENDEDKEMLTPQPVCRLEKISYMYHGLSETEAKKV